jgi:predicted DNA-binding ribbon-helix-helix protein
MSRSDPTSDLGAQVCRNVIVAGRRTSIRMEQIYWQELQNVVEREGNPLNEIISMVDMRRESTNLTAALRVFVICYMQEGPADGRKDSRIARALDVIGPPRKSAAE